jgi:hypothetical protein
MLDALLATFGALAVLASIAAKFVTSSADTVADDDAGRDQLHDNVMTLHALQSDRLHRRACKRARVPRSRCEQ